MIYRRLNWVLFGILAIEVGLLGYFVRTKGSVPSTRSHGRQADIVSLEGLEPSTVEAIRALEAHVSGRDAGACEDLAAVYRAFGLLPASDYYYRQALAIAPLSPKAQMDWAVTLSRLGQTEAARPLIEEARRRDDALRFEATLLLARDRLRENDAPGAEAYLREIPESIPAGVLLCRLLIREGRAEDALEHLKPLLAQAPDELRLHQMASWACHELGDEERTEGHWQRAVYCRDGTPRSDPSHDEDARRRSQFGSEALRRRAQTLLSGGKTAEAADALQEVFRTTGDHAAALQAAQIEHSAGRTERAEGILKEAVEWVGPTAEGQFLLGQMALVRGDADGAVEAWKRGLELRANRERMTNVSLLRSLFNQSAAKGDTEASNRYRGRLSFELGKFALEQGDLPNAVQQFTLATRQLPDHAPSWFYLGELMRGSGNTAAAIQAYNRCLQVDPNHGRARRALEMIGR